MLKRILDAATGIVHFVNPAHDGHTLCAMSKGTDLLGNWNPVGKPVCERVTCKACAKVVCTIRNEPYNTLDASVDDDTLMSGIYAAASPPTPSNALPERDASEEQRKYDSTGEQHEDG